MMFHFGPLQTPTLQHYMGYTEDMLVPVMQHIAKNVVRVNEGLSKHLVSGFSLILSLST